ncbi:hypothetical protein KCP76_26095 (plasmid) [Salmonella enterica subsp. enterica serovar Weltevreden]|nr:hypothetical protein KCP76_26095 [Salmonella enterica subsp. enterica serovar Weltevreden]
MCRRKEIELENAYGTDSGGYVYVYRISSLSTISARRICDIAQQQVQPGIHLQRLREKGFGRAELNCCCAADRRSSVPVADDGAEQRFLRRLTG